MADNILRYTLRADRKYFEKFKYIASYEGRSTNKEIEHYIKMKIAAFEKIHGEIDFKK